MWQGEVSPYTDKTHNMIYSDDYLNFATELAKESAESWNSLSLRSQYVKVELIPMDETCIHHCQSQTKYWKHPVKSESDQWSLR